MKKKLLSALMALSMLLGILFSAIPPLSALYAVLTGSFPGSRSTVQ